MFHLKLLELEAELLAKEQSERGFAVLPPDCKCLLQFAEKQVELRLGDRVPKDWRGWVTYQRKNDQLIVCRGRAFAEGGIFGRHRAGLDVPFGFDTITEYERGFDVSPPQDLDHLLLNFGAGEKPQVYLWYGQNLAPYKLIFMADVADYPYEALSQAIVEACIWILKRPKDKTLAEFLKDSSS
jgi:hypothetical protein